jgi:hypothetical protein
MSKFFSFLVLVVTLCSCSEVYNPDVDTDSQVLVVDAFLNNHISGNYVKLTKAIPYDTVGAYPRVRKATVYLTDNTDSIFYYEETSAGYYEPVSSSFHGVVNKTYILTVITTDGYTYKSAAETLLPEKEPDKVYGGFEVESSVETDAYGQYYVESEDVCAIYFDYTGETTTPRFRYTSTQIIEFLIEKEVNENYYTFYCWTTETDKTLRFTNETYSSSSTDIIKQKTCRTPATTKIEVFDLEQNDSGQWEIKDTLIDKYEYKRIVKVNQYRLNTDAYDYYKDVYKQTNSDGKIFDAIVSQVQTNMTCQTDTTKKVFGVFEASTLTTLSYVVSRKGVGSTITITRVDNVTPSSSEGFVENDFPDFWIK